MKGKPTGVVKLPLPQIRVKRVYNFVLNMTSKKFQFLDIFTTTKFQFLDIFTKKYLKLDDLLRFNGNLDAWWHVCCQITTSVWDFILNDIFRVIVGCVSLEKM